ncbi:MAG: hypothetical protein WC679_06680 [Bacteroidales bacterium]|jgi:hypothetical protein
MKKYSLMLFAMCFISIGLFAQVSRSKIKETQNNHFGFGYLYAVDLNNHKTNTFEYNDYFLSHNLPYAKLELSSSTFWGCYFEYQYDFYKRFSASTRLKFTFRNNTYDFNYSDYSTMNGKRLSSTNEYDLSLNSLEIPIILNYTIPMSENISWIASLGVGLNFNLSQTDSSIDGKLNALDLNDKTYHLDFEVLNNTSPFIYIGTAFDFNCKKHKFRTTIAYTLYPKENYSFNNYIKSEDLNLLLVSSPFSQNYLEISLGFFW